MPTNETGVDICAEVGVPTSSPNRCSRMRVRTKAMNPGVITLSFEDENGTGGVIGVPGVDIDLFKGDDGPVSGEPRIDPT